MTGQVKMDMRSHHRIQRADTADSLAVAAATYALDVGLAAVRARGRFTMVLAGGSTPRLMYQRLARHPDLRDGFPWPETHIFWGDERHVPPSHADSNFRMADETLLRHVPIDPSRIHRICAERPDASAIADDYERTIAAVISPDATAPPVFDLVLLGMGTDGHTASLFPRSAAIEEPTRLVVAPWVTQLGAYRITMTPVVFLNARAVAVLVAGFEKAAVLRDVLEGPLDPLRLPAQCLHAAGGSVTWFADAAAASTLSLP